jgi:hypothetical protein
MTSEQVARAYIELSRQLYAQHRDRRDLEWRVHLPLWTLLALTAYLAVTNNRHLGTTALLIFLIIPIHFIWIMKIHRGELRDITLSIRYRDTALRILGAFEPLVPPFESKALLRIDRVFHSYGWWLVADFGPTILISVVVYMLIR